jgi:hypothetical protein
MTAHISLTHTSDSKPVGSRERAKHMPCCSLYDQQCGLDAVCLLVEGRQVVAILAREEDALGASHVVHIRQVWPQLFPLQLGQSQLAHGTHPCLMVAEQP